MRIPSTDAATHTFLGHSPLCPCSKPCVDTCVGKHAELKGIPVVLRGSERLWSTDDRPNGVLIICKGAVTVSTGTAGGGQRVVDVCTQGTAIGIEEVLSPGGRCSDVDVVVSGTGLFVRSETITAALQAGGAPSYLIAELAVRAIRSMRRRIWELSYGTVEQRLARLLLRLSEDNGLADARGVFIPTKLSRVRAAPILGCRAETLVRCLNASDISDLISFTREGILLRDVAAVRTLADNG